MGILLAACSGGSGGGSAGPVVAASQEMNQDEEAAPSTSEMEESSASQEEKQADVSEEPTVSSTRQSAVSALFNQLSVEPSFGSVGASTGTLEGIESTFDGQRATVTMNRGAANDITLDTANAYNDSGDEASYVDLPGRTGRTRYVFDHTATSATLGLVATDWTNGDPDDYLAGGYWLHLEGNLETGQLTGAEAGAFVDGPELNLNDPPAMPISGTADYRGSSAGLYASVYGTDGGVPPGSAEIGEFLGVATLSADFSAGTIDGCVGCVGDVYLSGVYYDGITGMSSIFEDTPTDYQVNLGTVPFNRSNGTFQGSNVTVSSATAAPFESSGTWAGQFSNVPNNSGDPRLVGGAFGGHASTAGGTQALFIGAFAAGAQ